jgi:hypothetical protein
VINKAHFKRGKPSPDLAMVKNWFPGLPVVEAKHALRIQPSASDLSNSVRHDAQRCVFSQCARRMWGSHRVVFFGSTAYLDLLDSYGRRRVERFLISADGRRLIRDFDAGKKIKLRGFVLRPPSKTTMLKSKRRYAAEYHKKHGYAQQATKSVSKRKPTYIRYVEFEKTPHRAGAQA